MIEFLFSNVRITTYLAIILESDSINCSRLGILCPSQLHHVLLADMVRVVCLNCSFYFHFFFMYKKKN